MSVNWLDDRGHVIPPPPPAPPAPVRILPAAPRKSRRPLVGLVVGVALIGGLLFHQHENKVHARAVCKTSYQGLLDADMSTNESLAAIDTATGASTDQQAATAAHAAGLLSQAKAMFDDCMSNAG